MLRHPFTISASSAATQCRGIAVAMLTPLPQNSHAVMQETAVKVNEHLDKRGKRLEDVGVGEPREICREVTESIRR
jgi:hypothetical protein